MLALRQWTARSESAASGETVPGTAISSGLLFGLLLGIGFAAGAKEGVLLTLAVELLSLGLATAPTLHRGK